MKIKISKYQITEFANFAGTPVYYAYQNFINEMIKKGYSIGEEDINFNHKALAVINNKQKCIAFLTYFHDGYRNYYFITAGWVAKSKRKTGLYSTLYDRLRKMAKENKVVSIRSGIHVDNHVSKSMAKSLGRVPVAIIYKDDIK